jgi:hypothetical protein
MDPLPETYADKSYDYLYHMVELRSESGDDADAHISELRRASAAEPNRQEQLQQASEGMQGRTLQQQQGIQLYNSMDGRIQNEDNLIIGQALLPQEPPGVETDRTQLPFLLATTFPGGDLSRMPHLPVPTDNQFSCASAIPSARGHMAPSGRLALSEIPPTNPNTLVAVQDAAALNRFGRHDYDFQELTEHYNEALNFTAVEIITFLPTLSSNSSIARRFVNNGMDNATHTEIIDRHRVHCRNASDVAREYLQALRPANWPAMTGDQAKSLWSRKNQKVPDGWDARSLSMNAFVPDRIGKEGIHAPAPASVPFRILLQGVKKIPTGNDAADLTRAIEFANSDKAKHTFSGRDLMFPDDLINILTHIGHASITEQQRDRAVVGRYRKLYREKANPKKDSMGKGKGTSGPKRSKPRKDPVHSIPGEMSVSLLEPVPQTSPRMSETTRSSVSSQTTDTLHSAVQSRQVSESNSPMTPASFGKTREEEGHVKSHRLLRNLNLEALSNHDGSIEASIEASMETYQLACAVRYALRSDQKDVAWQDNPEHVAHISRALQHELEAELRPSDEHVAWEQNWERIEGKRQREMDDAIATLQHKLGLQVPYPRFTADDYEDLFGEPAPEHLLYTVEDLEEVLEGPSSGSSMQIDHSVSG